MNAKVYLKSRLTESDEEKIRRILNELQLYHPVWKLLSRLFNGFSLKEYEVLIFDLHFLLNYLQVHDREINLAYLLSLSKSCELLANHFTVEMLETYHAIYECLHVDSIQFKLMFEQLSEQFDASRQRAPLG